MRRNARRDMDLASVRYGREVAPQSAEMKGQTDPPKGQGCISSELTVSWNSGGENLRTWARLLTNMLKKTCVRYGSIRAVILRALDAAFVSLPVRLKCIVCIGPRDCRKKGSKHCRA